MTADLLSAAREVETLVTGTYVDLTSETDLTLARAERLTHKAPVAALTAAQLRGIYAEAQQRVRWEEPRDIKPQGSALYLHQTKLIVLADSPE